MKTPNHKQMMGRPSAWYSEYLDVFKIVYPNIFTQENYYSDLQLWVNDTNSTGVIRTHYIFLGWL